MTQISIDKDLTSNNSCQCPYVNNYAPIPPLTQQNWRDLPVFIHYYPLLSIYPYYMYLSVIGPLSFSNIYTILHNVTLYVLMSVLVSQITLPQLSNLKSKKLSIFNGRNPHLLIDHIMLIYNFPCNCIHYLNSILYFLKIRT